MTLYAQPAQPKKNRSVTFFSRLTKPFTISDHTLENLVGWLSKKIKADGPL